MHNSVAILNTYIIAIIINIKILFIIINDKKLTHFSMLLGIKF